MDSQRYTHKIERALWEDGKGIRLSKLIPEIGVANDVLDFKNDIHFGINSKKFNQYHNTHPEKVLLPDLGPRSLDIQKRGGRVAEYQWFLEHKLSNSDKAIDESEEKFRKKILRLYPKDLRRQIEELRKMNVEVEEARSNNETLRTRLEKQSPWMEQSFLEWLSEQDTQPIRMRSFPKGAEQFIKKKTGEVTSESVAGDAKYHPLATSKRDFDLMTVEQFGTRWSKGALEAALEKTTSTIHFHLDGMGSIKDILDKKGRATHNTTSRELRYLWRNWDRFKRAGRVRFYNGYTKEDGDVVEVYCPWDNEEVTYLRQKPKLTAQSV